MTVPKFVQYLWILISCTLGFAAYGQISYELKAIQGKQVVITYHAGVTKNVNVFVGEHSIFPEDQIAVAGKLTTQDSATIFEPYLAFRPGLIYTIFTERSFPFSFSIPYLKEQVIPQLEQLYPSIDELPANQLKFYLQFNTPMQEGKAYDMISILDESGNPMEEPFVRLHPELWNADRTRLTLWMDPGRIKRELGPNQEAGNPLEIGHNYTLEIKENWESSQGISLKQSYRKSFHVIDFDRRKPDISEWIIKAPAPKTVQSILIRFPEPMDWALAQRVINIFYNGQLIEGDSSVTDQETCWQFTPQLPWKPGTYRIRVDTIFEDLAGNNLNRLFDTDLTTTLPDQDNRDFIWMEFEIDQ